MGLVKWTKRPKLAQVYLDWLLSPEAQGIWADSFWPPTVREYMTENARQKMKPLHGSYDLVKRVSIADKQKILETYRKMWVDEVRQK
jgi:ABC-type Fe3+ transport system substrate-binding protein